MSSIPLNVSRETFVEIGNCKLYHGDSIRILSELKDAADLIVTDPPYKLTAGGIHSSLGGCLSVENYNNKGGIVECDIDWPDFMPLLYGALKAGKQAYVMCNNRHIAGMINASRWPKESKATMLLIKEIYMEMTKDGVVAGLNKLKATLFENDEGFGFHNMLVWDKGTATPNRWYMKNCEFTGFFFKSPAKFINDCGAKQLINCPQVDVSDHPTEKPVPLMRHYIDQSSDRGDLVLDPFMGSGTTGVAAVHAGRRFIGIEKNEKFFNVAVQRIMDAVDNFQERLL